MKKFILIFLILVLIAYYITLTAKKSSSVITINNRKIIVEIADNDKERTQGLSGRKSLSQNHGMLFIFPTKSIQRFWMKDMHFPIDIIWIDGDKIVGFSENLKPGGSNPKSIYSLPKPVDKVLEVPVGTVKELNIKIGDTIVLSISS